MFGKAKEVKIEIGRGHGDFLNVSGASECDRFCCIQKSSRFICTRYNEDLVVQVFGGITRDTPHEFRNLAECCK